MTINGAHNCRRVEIDPSLLEDDKEMLEDWLLRHSMTRRVALKRRRKRRWPLFLPECSCRALRCRSDANQPAVNSAYGSTALSAGRWPEVGAAHGVHAASARSQRRDASGAGVNEGDVGNRPLCRLPHLHRARRLQHLFEPASPENGQICVVESPADIYAIEQTGQFSGRYFVLMGHLSPLDGIGPDDIGLDRLEQRLASEQINELITATNPTVEGGDRQLYC